MDATSPAKPRIRWYRSPVTREQLRELNTRSDLFGFLQTLGYLGMLALTGSLAIWSSRHWPWWATVALLFVHGTCWSFQINGFHELVHDSVFKTRRLNAFFLGILSFLGWLNHHYFWRSHTEHHKYTLHPPDDLEVVLPQKPTPGAFLKTSIINPMGLWWTLHAQVNWALGRLPGKWGPQIFPKSDPAGRRKVFNWSRFILLGHAAIIAASIATGWWIIAVVVSAAPFYGNWLFFLCNASQHVGLQDNVPDYRLCCRTIHLNPVARFLYWHMNYHTEHHMYAAVPCYKLGRLHRIIKADLPDCPRGLIATWTQIWGILRKQKEDPGYQYIPALPTPRD